MATTTNLGKIHIFPSETSYSNNKSSIDSNDIALIKSDVIEKLKGNTTPTLTALVDWDRMKALNGGTDVRNYSDNATGLTTYGGDCSFPDVEGGIPRQGTILLKQSYTNFDKLLVIASADNAKYCLERIWDVWEFQSTMNMGGVVNLMEASHSAYWDIKPHKAPNFAPLSTETTFFVYEQNSSIVEIYGVKY